MQRYNIPMETKIITLEEAIKYISQLYGLPVSAHIWYGGTLVLEIGKMIEVKVNSPKKTRIYSYEWGEYTMVIEGSWKIIDGKKEMFWTDGYSREELVKPISGGITNFIIDNSISTLTLSSGCKIIIGKPDVDYYDYLRLNKIDSDTCLSYTQKGVFEQTKSPDNYRGKIN